MTFTISKRFVIWLVVVLVALTIVGILLATVGSGSGGVS